MPSLKPFRSALVVLSIGLSAAVPGSAVAADLDGDALALQSDAPPTQDPAATKLLIEAGLGLADQRYGLGTSTISRAAVDLRHASRWTPAVQGALSARLDARNPQDARLSGAVLSVREAYVGWQDGAAARVLELGRINQRDGPGYGYNPTDFFRDNAVRTVTTADPLTLRENRLGSVMLRAQTLWAGGSLAALYAPQLSTNPTTEGLNFDLAATNARDRGMVTLGTKFSDQLNTQLLIYKEAGSEVRVGASATALVSDAAVVHAEWSYGREPTLLSRALSFSQPQAARHRLSTGLTYTAASRLSITGEYQYNGFALDGSSWNALAAGGAALQGAYFSTAGALQDNAGRQSVLLYAAQPDLLLKNLALTALVKFNTTDHSRLFWTDLRYRSSGMDVALQVQHHMGGEGSEFGVLPVRTLVGVLLSVYF